ncbi:hypothetical protein SFC43_11695 [Bacteroides sp. CR5/BHMF/2]|nr:hypothetical protein [Bacteroides sp. CR5/BHMF/2]
MTIRLKGTDFGTTTDINGDFKLFILFVNIR